MSYEQDAGSCRSFELLEAETNPKPRLFSDKKSSKLELGSQAGG